MEFASVKFLPDDPRLIDHIVGELKSQGIFDRFRKECIADVDTKPAYQNLRQRVEGNVSSFLNKQRWKPDMNKNHTRELLRRNIQEPGFLETGVERIVDQVVNPKIKTTFFPQVEEVVYKFLGLEKPSKDANHSEILSINTTNLLPTDLDPISPASDKAHIKSTVKEDVKNESLDDSTKIDDDESPPFEPLDMDISFQAQDENSNDSHLSGISGLTSHGSRSSTPIGNSFDAPEISNAESQISKVSSNSRLSIVTNDGKHTPDINESNFEIDAIKREIESDFRFEPKNENFEVAQIKAEDNIMSDEIISALKREISAEVENESKLEEKNIEVKKEEIEKKEDAENQENGSGKDIVEKKHDPKVDEKKKMDRSRKDSENKHRSRDRDEKKHEKKDRHSSSSSNRGKSKDHEKRDKHYDKSKESKKDYKSENEDKEKSKEKISKSESKDSKEKSLSKPKDVKDKYKSKDDKDKDKNKDSKSKLKESDEKSKSSKSTSSSSSMKTERKHSSSSSSKDRSRSSKSLDKSREEEKKSKEKTDVKTKSSEKDRNRSSSKHSLHRSSSSHDKKDSSKKESSKRISKDEHCSSKSKSADNRRSTDRDSNDGTSGSSSQNSNSQSSNQSTAMKEITNEMSSESHSGESGGQSDINERHEDVPIETSSSTRSPVKLNIGDSDEVNLPINSKKRSLENDELDASQFSTEVSEDGQIHVKLKKPKFASNIFEARRLMKVRKRLDKLQRKREKELNTAQAQADLDNEHLPNGIAAIRNKLIVEDTDSCGSHNSSKMSDLDSKVSRKNSSNTSKGEVEGSRIIYSDEEEDCLYFSPKPSPTEERFLKQVANLEKTTPNVPQSVISEISDKINSSYSLLSTRRSRKPNMKYCSDDYASEASILEHDTPSPNSEKRKMRSTSTKRKIGEEIIDEELENNNVKSMKIEKDENELAAPNAASVSEIKPVKQNKGKKNKQNRRDSLILPPSPESDVSASSGEQKVSIAGKENEVNISKAQRNAAKVQKATQRYSSDDLYKPRPVIGTTRRSRAAQGQNN